MIKEIAKLLNESELGYSASLGYSSEKSEGIFILDTNSQGVTNTSIEDSIQILVQVNDLVMDPYLKAKEISERIISILKEETEAYQVRSRYVGANSTLQIFSINFKIGGVR
ncbi:MAG: hypothetical protein RR795_01230 [Cetobacterium sp.]|uniref:hypothetical protein n=1 Tax=Cetobacterium sp. TaxID=2071632 RepID=UPI002FC8CFBC